MKTVTYGRGFWVITACLLLILPLSVQAQMKGPPVPFSADWAEYDYEDDDDYDDDDDDYDDDGYRGRLFASTEGIRVEVTAGDESGVLIVNYRRMVGWFLMESERTYRVIDPDDPDDPDDFDDWALGLFGSPCPTDARATPSGSETLDGRRTEKWTCVSPEWGTMTAWYDTRLQTVIRSEDEDGYYELTNIREGRQPASLFVLPAGYSKMDVPE